MSGTPGYDFGTNELVSAEKLRRWIERARWADLSYSETSGELVGLRVQNTQPSDTTEGLLWYRPDMQKMHVYTRRGWVGIFNAMSYETIRLKNYMTYGGTKARLHKIYNVGDAAVSAGAAAINYGGIGVCSGLFVDTMVSGQTLVADGYYPLVCWGLCGVDADSPIDTQSLQYPIKPNSVGQLTTPITDTSLALNELNIDAVGIALDVTLTPAIHAYYPLFFFGFPIHIHRGNAQ